MIVANVARAIVLLLLIAPDRLELHYSVAAIQRAIRLLFGPAESTRLPTLVDEERLVATAGAPPAR